MWHLQVSKSHEDQKKKGFDYRTRSLEEASIYIFSHLHNDVPAVPCPEI